MNKTLRLQDLPNAYLVIGGIGAVLLIIYLISIIVIFPLYVYVYRLNRKTEKLAYFYPITKHFYSVICSMQFYIYVTLSIGAITWLFFDLTAAGCVFIVSLFFAYFVAITVTSVQNVLLFILALRLFMILFFPNFKKVISINQKSFQATRNLLYIVYSLIQIISKLVKIFCGTESAAYGVRTFPENMSLIEKNFDVIYDECSSTIDLIYVRIYVAGDILVMFAAIMYVIMFMKIRRWSKMTGDQLNNPEKYIFYQTVLIVVTKLLAINVILVMCYQDGYSDDWAFGAFVVSDVLTTPFVIQGSYLLCNRTNVDTVLSIQFKTMKTWKMIICGLGSVAEGRQRRREFKMRIYAAKKKAKDLIRGSGKDGTISKPGAYIIPVAQTP